MASSPSVLDEIKRDLAEISQKDYLATSTRGLESYQSRLQEVSNSLSNELQSLHETLSQLRTDAGAAFSLEPSHNPKTRHRQLKGISRAYSSLLPSPPNLPPGDSPIPALLAVRNLQRLNYETNDCIPDMYERVVAARSLLQQEEVDLRDARSLKSALEARIELLRQHVSEKTTKSTEEIASALLEDESVKFEAYKKEKKMLVKALRRFIDEHLAAMLAAEELGGPVVGDLLEITEDMLANGFTRTGREAKPKKPKKKKRKPSRDGNYDEDGEDSGSERQRRNDQIWGVPEEDMPDRTETDAAAWEACELIEELMNTAVEHGNSVYLTLDRDAAAARFLVRSKVAQLHPKDARKIRLLDFGRELES